jgi:hypothetical protein
MQLLSTKSDQKQLVLKPVDIVFLWFHRITVKQTRKDDAIDAAANEVLTMF